VATLVTPKKIRDLQRALYMRAKKEPKFRFYALYDKVYRVDILEHAYRLARANGGAPGPDGVTFKQIEQIGPTVMLEELHDALKTKTYRPGPVRRVYIPKLSGAERPLGIPNIRDRVVQTAAKLVLEPIFEADFDPDSYGFRPKRDAHQALDAIKETLDQGMYWIIDADLASYFDTIPHDRLMKAVAERVVDGAMLALVKMFLEAPIVDERDGGRPRRNSRGTPQGGTMSPLLANIYLNLLDRNFRRREALGEVRGRLVRYADDLVVLAPNRPDATLQWMQSLLQRMGLSLNTEKTKVKQIVGKESFNFLGHRHFLWFGKTFLDIADKAHCRTKDELRRITRRTWLSLDVLVGELNAYIRGARHYFRRVRRRTLSKLDRFVEERIARWWSRKHSLPQPAWSLVRKGALWRRHGLERWALPRHLRPADSRGAT
jgi:group II intron reverse transcriptase/maturase